MIESARLSLGHSVKATGR